MRTPLRYLLNPCDLERMPVLARLGDFFAAVWDRFVGDTDCPCCLGARLLATLSTVAGLSAGFTFLMAR